MAIWLEGIREGIEPECWRRHCPKCIYRIRDNKQGTYLCMLSKRKKTKSPRLPRDYHPATFENCPLYDSTPRSD